MMGTSQTTVRWGRSPSPIVLIILFSAIGSGLIVWLLPPPGRPPATEPAEYRPAELNSPVPEFSLVDQRGEPVTREDLKGKIWIASFIFTRCHGTCPTVSATMARLRDELPSDVELVSFSVDPRHDTPEVLAGYAEHFQADPGRWHFLTGDREQIYNISRDGFQFAVYENKDPRTEPGDLVTHSNRLVIVDREGVARSTYNSLDPSSVDLLIRAVEKLRSEKS